MEMNKNPINLTDSELSQITGGADEPAAKYAVGQRVTIGGAGGPALDFGVVANRRYANGTWQYIINTDSGSATDWLNESQLRTSSERTRNKGIMK